MDSFTAEDVKISLLKRRRIVGFCFLGTVILLIFFAIDRVLFCGTGTLSSSIFCWYLAPNLVVKYAAAEKIIKKARVSPMVMNLGLRVWVGTF